MIRSLSRAALCGVVFLAACASPRTTATPVGPVVSDEILESLQARPSDNQIAADIKAGVKLIKRGRYEAAGKVFAAGLRLNPTDGNLHFLNALSYHLRSLSGDRSMLEFAEAGYALALRFDASNYWAAYLLGHVYFEQNHFSDAQNQFSYALLYAPDNPILLRAMAVASYYADGLELSHWAAERAVAVDPNNYAGWRTAAITRAAVGDAAGARRGLRQYENLLASLPAARKRALYDPVAGRVQDWNGARHGRSLLAQAPGGNVFGTGAKAEGGALDLGDASTDNYDGPDTPAPTLPSPSVAAPAPAAPVKVPPAVVTPVAPAAPVAAAPAPDLPKMTLVDVVIIRTEENRSQSKGVNLLDGIKATLTGTLYAFNRVTGVGAGGAGAYTQTHTIAPTLALAGLQYDLNIFNDGLNKAEVLARPSLLAVDNKMSSFYSGTILHVQLNSNNSDGSLVDVPVGIALSITPSFIDNETVSIMVHAERNFIESNDSKLGFSVFSQTSKTSVDATAVLKFGQTLILSGLSENETVRSESGVPFFQSIPGVQYLFSRKTKGETKKSVLILLSPHRERFAGGDITKASADDATRPNHTETLRRREKLAAFTNTDAAIDTLRGGRYFGEIRTGDLRLDEWHNSDSLFGALKRVLGFLYY